MSDVTPNDRLLGHAWPMSHPGRRLIAWLERAVTENRSVHAGTPLAYLLAAVAVLVALGVRLAIGGQLSGAPFVTFYPATIVATLFWGARAGLLTIPLGVLAVSYGVLGAPWAGALPDDGSTMLAFVVLSTFYWIAMWLLRQTLIALQQERRRQEHLSRSLEQRVDERTRSLARANDDLEQAVARLRTEEGERLRAEEQLRQVQKMEVIGQLSGGIAHDFNNLLTVVIGQLDAVLRRGGDLDQAGRERLAAAATAADRAAKLTNRLLAFARRQPLAPVLLDANRLVAGMSELLRRTLGEKVALETVLAGGLWRLEADQNQLENALLNLAVNARDAMPGGGRLTIETANAHLDEAYAAQHAEVVPGQYVVIAITDTGAGMPPSVVARAFDPFFTTKEVGHGTGLGLSQVYGFVKQSGGHVKIYSELGAGTTIKIYLRRALDGDLREEAAPAAESIETHAGGRIVLLVEDDELVRMFTATTLADFGYRVLEARDGPSGLEMVRSHPEIELLLTDVGLPGGMTGRVLADRAREIRPDLPVLYTTGYARNAIVHNGVLDPGVMFIGKPFTADMLAQKLAEAFGDVPARR